MAGTQTGVRKFNTTKGKFEGHYSDLFLLHQRCIYHEIEDLSPIELGERSKTPYLKARQETPRPL